jgi:ribosomal protein L11 methylase PrmA
VGRILLEVGSVPEVRKGDFIIKQAPLVVANILSHVLVRLLDEGLEDLVSKGGNLVLSGILEEGQTPVLDALQNHHLKVVDRRQIEDWVAFVVTRA